MGVGHRLDRKLILHANAPGLTERAPQLRTLNKLCNRFPQCIDVFRRNQNAGLVIHHRFCCAPCGKSYHRNGSRGRFERGNPKPFGKRRMNQNINTSEIAIDVGPESCKLDRTSQAESGGLLPEFVLERALTEDDQLEIREPCSDLRYCFEQVAMTFAGN